MEKAMKITAPEGFEIKDVKILDGVTVIMFSKKERELPKSWEVFCEMVPIKKGECEVNFLSEIIQEEDLLFRNPVTHKKVLPNRVTAEAVLALCQLVQLRDCYNGDWVPDWTNQEAKFIIYFNDQGDLVSTSCCSLLSELLFFKNEKLRDEFLRNFRHLIEKLKPLYGLKGGGAE